DQSQSPLARDFLDRRTNGGDDFRGGLLVRGRGAALRTPYVLDETLVIGDGALQRLVLLLPLRRRKDRALVAHFVTQLADRLFLLGGLVAPALHLAIEAILRVLCVLELGEDARRVDVADPRVGGACPLGRKGRRQRGERAGGDEHPLRAVTRHGALASC